MTYRDRAVCVLALVCCFFEVLACAQPAGRIGTRRVVQATEYGDVRFSKLVFVGNLSSNDDPILVGFNTLVRTQFKEHNPLVDVREFFSREEGELRLIGDQILNSVLERTHIVRIILGDIHDKVPTRIKRRTSTGIAKVNLPFKWLPVDGLVERRSFCVNSNPRPILGSGLIPYRLNTLFRLRSLNRSTNSSNSYPCKRQDSTHIFHVGVEFSLPLLRSSVCLGDGSTFVGAGESVPVPLPQPSALLVGSIACLFLFFEDIMKHEYHEGPEAKERFEKLATKLFRAPKSTVKSKAKPERKAKKASKD
ncbi:hypothetical protein [Edaphobacter modestus]|uniref:Uncharacterized protein n=1 Tax=Edaphobacter modestus TaxID=388466 RepID=A0A4Q7Z046_9BACT|nr:hypothetical protein [Edaphobacter modestus]RZU42825.1 hypothetical protein BDD14_4421 [Edaphobacter modestus]